MIPVIGKGKFFKGLIAYNEDKVEAGEAELLINNTLGQNPAGYNHDFLSLVAKKPHTKDPAVQIVLSFAKTDKLDNAKLVELSLEYLEAMGYGASPYLIYRHYDTDHDHVHIVTSRVNYDIKVVDTHKDFHKSLEVSRLMEEKHGLHKVIYRQGTDQQLSQINADRYAFQNGLKKAIKDPVLSAQVEPKVLAELRAIFEQGQSISNSRAEMLYDKKGLKNEFNSLNQILKENGLLRQLDKDVLVAKLDGFKRDSTDFKDFQAKVEKEGLYMRILQGKKEVVFGFREKSFYLKDKQLPRGLRYLSLIDIGKNKTYSRSEQQKFISFHVRGALKHSYRLEDFINRLGMKGIETTVHQDKRGIYGFSFKNISVEEGTTFKASELGSRKEFTVEKILETISSNATNYQSPVREKFKEFVPVSYPVNLNGLAKSLDERDSEDQSDELKRGRGIGA